MQPSLRQSNISAKKQHLVGGCLAAVVLMLAAGTVPGLAQTGPSLPAVGQATLDAAYAAWSPADDALSGIAAGYQLPNGTTWLGAAGYTDLSHTTPLTPAYQFRVGSQTKTYTATVVLQMVDQGLIGLNQTVAQLLPGLALNNASQITVQQLLNMTSGIPEYLQARLPTGQTLEEAWAQSVGQLNYSAQTLILMSNQLPPTNAPGAQMNYSNTNYQLLGMIAQNASCATASGCQTIGQLIQSRILTPLGLTNTYYPTNDQFTGPYAHGYEPLNGVLTDFSHMQPGYSGAAGAMISTPADELKWIEELTSNSAGLLTPAMHALQLTGLPGETLGGRPAQYGLGIYYQANPTNGAVLLGHAGAINGYSAYMGLDTGSNIAFVANLAGDDAVNAPIAGATTVLRMLNQNVDTAVAAKGNCTAGSNDVSAGGTCQGANVRTGSLTVTGGTLTIGASGQTYAGYRPTPDGRSATPAPTPVPSIAFFGDGMAGLVLANGGSATVAPGALLTMTGANSTAVRLAGTGGSLTIAGGISTATVPAPALGGAAWVSTPGSLALDIGGNANTVVVTASGAVTGQVAIGGNGNSYQVAETSTGDVTVGGSSNVVSGTGLISGTLSNAGGNVVAPGVNGAGTLTVGAYAGNGGTLRIGLGPAGLTSALDVLTTATLGGDRLQLVRAPGTPDVVEPVLYAPGGISGSFASVDPDPGPAVSLAQTATTTTVATVSSGLFDAAADLGVGSLQRQQASIVDRVTGLVGSPTPAQSSAGIAGGHATAWISGIGNILDATAADGSPYHASASGVIVGADVAVTPEVLAGFSYSHQMANATLGGTGSKAASTSDVGGVYGALLRGRFFAAANVLAGAGSDVLTRTVLLGSATVGQTGRPADTRIGAGLVAGLSVPVASFQLIPRLGLSYRGLRLDGYTESGPAPLTVGSVVAQQMQGEAVVNAVRRLVVGDGTLSVGVHVGLEEVWSLGSGQVLATMQGFPQPFALDVRARSGTFALVGAGIQYQLLHPALALYAAYDGEVGGPGTSSGFSGGLRFVF
jgi:CubicO group peptidase (beta-lactamase class C family)